MAPCGELALVSTFIGSGGYGYGTGSVAPAAQLPFSPLRLGPDTAGSALDAGYRHCSGYNWDDNFVRAFSHTRLVGAGVTDMGNVGIMPLRLPPMLGDKAWGVEDFGFTDSGVQAVDTTPIKWWSEYDKATESGSPGRYAVTLMGPNATAEMLAISPFAGYHRYTFAAPAPGQEAPGLEFNSEKNGASSVGTPQPVVAIDVCHAGAEKADPREPNFCINANLTIGADGSSFDAFVHYRGSLSGDVMPVYLHGSLPGKVASWTVCSKDGERCRAIVAGETVSSASGVLFALAHLPRASSSKAVVADVLVGLSFQSVGLARANLAAALDAVAGPASSFEALAEATETTWCSALSALHVDAGPSDPDLPVLLHSAHYRTLMSPTMYAEPGTGSASMYIGLDQKLHSSVDDAVAIGGVPQGAATSENKASDVNPASFEAWAASSQAHALQHFSDISGWDVFRCQFPWLLLTQEPLAQGLIRSMAVMAQQQNAFPRWVLGNHEGNCMIGQHAASMIVDALLTFTDPAAPAPERGSWAAVAIDASAAAQPVLNNQATVVGAPGGREDLEHYLATGFVSLEATDGAAVSTLTFAYDDYVLGAMSERLAAVGGGGLDLAALQATAEAALARSKNYKNVWSKELSFMCPRSNGAGNYSTAMDDDSETPLVCTSFPGTVAVASKWYREGDAWHYAYWAPQDVPGLVALHSSPQAFHDNVEMVMAKSVPNSVLDVLQFGEAKPNDYYWAGNEHDLLHPWLFNYGPNCSATQLWTRKMTELHYSTKHNGIPGNDDYGAMSSWLLFASLGFYPNAGMDTFLLGSPRVANATLRLNLVGGGSDASLRVVAHNQGPANYFVERLLVDGKEWASAFITRAVLAAGPTLEFFLSADPTNSGLCPKVKSE